MPATLASPGAAAQTSVAAGYPVVLRLERRRCAVVGPAASAAPRIAALAAAGADAAWLGARAPARAALRGLFLCLVTADAPLAVARRTAAAARAAGALVWCGDRPALCDVTLPAILRRGRVQIAVSTGGASPTLAKRLRDRIGAVVGERVAREAERLARKRRATGR
jgi:siroheme synthase (precorrin-2 oxidase/ferrochelatase)